ncbi:hypothetical protein [Cryobacterium serini]|uniref:Nitroreductase domain-containing protein n=1 Tax=Cryobacterium serini TaxID=1259201 RepID=A0A4R9BUI3_9MICO|nr:hypothetical protein [Cryobacterium serini]TFD90043.1 hypothetical protein E3T51_04910 [Cryobacterium serini]
MGGLHAGAIAAARKLTDDQAVVSVTAIGVLGKPSDLTPELREREIAPRSRKPLAELLLTSD